MRRWYHIRNTVSIVRYNKVCYISRGPPGRTRVGMCSQLPPEGPRYHTASRDPCPKVMHRFSTKVKVLRCFRVVLWSIPRIGPRPAVDLRTSTFVLRQNKSVRTIDGEPLLCYTEVVPRSPKTSNPVLARSKYHRGPAAVRTLVRTY